MPVGHTNGVQTQLRRSISRNHSRSVFVALDKKRIRGNELEMMEAFVESGNFG